MVVDTANSVYRYSDPAQGESLSQQPPRTHWHLPACMACERLCWIRQTPPPLRVRSMPHTTLYRMPDDPLLEPLRRQDPPRDDAFWRPKQAWLVSTSPIALDWAAVGGVPDMGNLVRCVLECSP